MPIITPTIRQMTIVLSSQLAALSVGGAVTYPTLVMERFRVNDTSIQLDMDTKSWIGSIYGLAGIPAALLPFLAQKIGRKWGYILTCLFLIIGWILTYIAKSSTELLISESFQGLGTNSLLPVCFLGMTEMLAPKYRAPCIHTFGIAQGIGMAACGILGRYIHYKTVSLIMLVPIFLAAAIALMWPESPPWYAWKGDYVKCEQAFLKLRDADDNSTRELRELIRIQKENLRRKKRETINLKKVWMSISSRDFYMPMFHVFMLFLMMYWSGCDAIYIYFIEIVVQSSNNSDAAFSASIVMYLIVLGGMIITNITVTKFKNKTILSCSTCAVIIFLLISSLLSGLQSLNLLPENSLLPMYSLIGYMVCISLGLNSIVFLTGIELLPVKHRSLGGALYVIINCVLYASSLKLSPYISSYLGLWCTFLIYAINASACLLFVWKNVPETQRKSLQEIENYYTTGSFAQTCVDEDNPADNIFLRENTKYANDE